MGAPFKLKYKNSTFPFKDDKKKKQLEEKDKYSIYIKKNKDVLPWKDFNKNMAISIEYNLEY